jgi:hypothetical protein
METGCSAGLGKLELISLEVYAGSLEKRAVLVPKMFL